MVLHILGKKDFNDRPLTETSRHRLCRPALLLAVRKALRTGIEKESALIG
jgi:hypothetical protein